MLYFAVVKEREMEIGYPTDVKHVAHIGWDGPSGSGSAPSWVCNPICLFFPINSTSLLFLSLNLYLCICGCDDTADD